MTILPNLVERCIHSQVYGEVFPNIFSHSDGLCLRVEQYHVLHCQLANQLSQHIMPRGMHLHIQCTSMQSTCVENRTLEQGCSNTVHVALQLVHARAHVILQNFCTQQTFTCVVTASDMSKNNLCPVIRSHRLKADDNIEVNI